MNPQTIIYLSLIGLMAGVLSGFVGVGGWNYYCPCVSFPFGNNTTRSARNKFVRFINARCFFGLLQYWKTGNVNWKFGLVIALTFLIGAWIGSKLSLKMSPSWVKFIFGILTAYVSFRLISSGYQEISNGDA